MLGLPSSALGAGSLWHRCWELAGNAPMDLLAPTGSPGSPWCFLMPGKAFLRQPLLQPVSLQPLDRLLRMQPHHDSIESCRKEATGHSAMASPGFCKCFWPKVSKQMGGRGWGGLQPMGAASSLTLAEGTGGELGRPPVPPLGWRESRNGNTLGHAVPVLSDLGVWGWGAAAVWGLWGRGNVKDLLGKRL